jgi:hypothetical protein
MLSLMLMFRFIFLLEPNDQVFTSNACSHRFHKDCIMNWLERRANTECPCCREPMVSDEDVWQIVKQSRKERRKQLRQENGLLHRCTRWMLRNRHQEEDCNNAPATDELFEHTEVSSSTRSVDVEEGRVNNHRHDDDDDNNNLGQDSVPTLSETESDTASETETEVSDEAPTPHETESDTASETETEVSDEAPTPHETESDASSETETELSDEAPIPHETESDASSETETELSDEKTRDNEESTSEDCSPNKGHQRIECRDVIS